MDYRALAEEAARKNGVPVDLFLRLINQESRFNPSARSPVGAIGLAQLMPGTASDLRVNPHDPIQNLDGGARYLRQQLDKFGRPELALAAYNAGPGAVQKYGGIPPYKETQNYVKTILGAPAPAAASGGAAAPGRQPGNSTTLAPYGQPNTGALLDPMGILDFFANQSQPEEPEEQGFWTRDRKDKLAIGLEGMTLNPNQTRMKMLSEGIKDRGDQRKQTAQTNKTVALLMSKRPDLAALVSAGALTPGDAVKLMMTPGADKTALQQNVEFLVAQGYTIEEALKRVSSAAGASEGDYLGTIPAGHQLVRGVDENGNQTMQMIPVSGSPQEREVLDAQQADQNRTATTEKYRSQVVRAAEAAANMLEKNGSGDILPDAGIWGDKLGRLGINQEAVNIRNALATVKSGVAFDRLQEMREASKTGGALGAVSAPELELLMASLGSIEQSNDPALLKSNLMHIVTIMTKIENDPIASQVYHGGPIQPGAMQQPAPQPAQQPPAPTGAAPRWRVVN